MTKTVDDIDRRLYEHAERHDKFSKKVRGATDAMHLSQECMEETYPKVITRLEHRCETAVRHCEEIAKEVSGGRPDASAPIKRAPKTEKCSLPQA